MIQLKDIKKNPNNPRLIKDAKFERLRENIERYPKFLELRPIVIESWANPVILGGNMRYEALKALGYKEIPNNWVREASGLSEEARKAFLIIDNVGFGEWDNEILQADWDIEELESWGLDVGEWEEDVEQLEAKEDYYEMPETVQTDIVLGDLFEIGEHRLLCGDSTDSDQVAKLMNGEKADMVFTDPPYEIDFNYANTLLFSENCHVFIFNNDRALIRQLQNSPIEFKKFFVFHHSGTAIPQDGGNEVFLDHVLVSHEINGEPKVKYNKGNGTRSVIKGEYRRAEEHKHQKPISFISPIIQGYSNEGFLILDFFAGGGSTMVAAHQLKRRCFGMELDCKYVQVIVDRMRKLDPSLVIKKNGKLYGQAK